ncbi:MAG: hypothetical protein HY349_00115 [Nitrospirae bacterium]|nr:hypothetical protein [Nitrospirota bacterium]
MLGGKLYAGIGEDVGGAAGEGDDVWVCDPAAAGVSTTICDAAADWSVLPDMDGAATNIEAVTSLAVFNGKLYAGACCTAGADDQVYVYDPVGNTWNLSRSFAGTYESVRSLADYNGSLYAGLGDTNSTDGDIYRCFPANDSAGPLGTTTCDNSVTEWPVSLDSAVAGASLALAVYAGNLYVGQGTAAAAGDVYVFVAGWKTVARQFSAGAWATSEVAGNVCASGADDGICMIAGGAALTPASSPVVAMDASGRAIAAFVRLVAATCFAPPTVDVDASAANRSITLVSFTCYDSALWVNQFDVALTPDWGGVTGAINIDPNAPVDGDPTATDSPFMCFQNSDADVPSGNLQGFSTACQNVSQPRIAMDRAGVAIVTAKVWWQEDETSQDNTDTNCSNGVNIDGERICNDAGQHTSPPGGPPACLGGIGDGYGAIPVCAADEWSGNAIAVRRYDGAGWTAADWPTAAPSLQFLYAHSNQPSEAADLGGSERFYNCPAAGRVLTDTSRFLVECDLNAPQITMGDTDNNPATVTDVALVVWERFDGTNHDVYADCFSQTAVTTCGGAAVAGWRSSFAVPEPGTATNDNYTASYFVLNDIAASRMAFSPQVALDATGNGLAVWTQRDVNQWRVYGMRFQAGTGFVAASRVPIDSLGSDPSCSSGACMYSNPVLSMEWVNAGNAANCPAGVSCGSAWALMLDTELFGGALLPPILNVRILAHQWTPP